MNAASKSKRPSAVRDIAQRFGISQKEVLRLSKKHKAQTDLAFNSLSISLSLMGIIDQSDTDAVFRLVLEIIERNALAGADA